MRCQDVQVNVLYQEWNVVAIGFVINISKCNVDMCKLLKPITDYVFEECITENIVKKTPLADIRKR